MKLRPLSLLVFLVVVGLGVSRAQVLSPGDVAIVGINANNGGCSVNPAEDEISFICFKAINTGTRLWFTDKGYEFQNAGFWGTISEGVVQLSRSGAALPAGSVVTFRINSAGTVVSVSAGWTASTIVTGMNLNSGGDQVFVFQANVGSSFTGASNNGVFNNCTLLYGFSTRAAPNDWVSFQNSTQFSGLPPGSLCFSMAPSSSTDFIKYVPAAPDVFPTYTSRTQRQWIIDIDDPNRWVSQGSCTVYNTATATSPNYAGGFTFPITGGGFINGVWTGAKSTDWFDCRNWDDAEVPIATSNVIINPALGATQSCVVGVNVSTPSTAVCASLLVATAGTARNLAVDNGRVLNVGGNTQVVRSGGTGPVGITITNGTFTSANLTLTGTGAGLNQAYFRNEVPANTVNLSGNLQISPGGYLDLWNGAVAGGTINLSGNYTNNDAATAFDEAYSTINFNGTAPQSINTNAFTENFGSLSVAKATNDLTLNAPSTVSGVLTLTNGRIFTTTNLLTLLNGSSTTGVSNSSFVHGPMQKIGTTDFTFPIGKGNNYRPCALTLMSGVATDGFEAEYFNADPHLAWGTPLDVTLDHISQCEYWMISRSVGSANAWVYLSWDTPISCGVSLLADLRVARWNGSMWEDKGNGDVQGNAMSGIVATNGQQSAFSPWTLASVSTENPLPIELMWFKATPKGRQVDLDWATATERNNDHFTVERSVDGTIYEPILTQQGAGDSWSTIQYNDVDRAPLPGISYYRLMQTDVDGSHTWSDPVVVNRPVFSDEALAVYSDGGSWTAVHGFPMGSIMEVMDMTGRIVWHGTASNEGRAALPLESLNTGAYVLRMIDGERVESVRFTR